MTYATQRLSYAAIITISALSAAVAHADDQLDRYLVTNLVSDIAGIAPNTDAVLQNAWGVAFTPAASPFWVADNATGCSTLYDGAGAKQNLQVKIPAMFHLTSPTAMGRMSMVKEIGHATRPFRRSFP
jgi:hypothetical protein